MSRTAATEGTAADWTDVRVYWYGNIQVWLDDIRIESSDRYPYLTPSALFSGQYDAQITAEAQKFNSKPGLGRFYLKDEPYITQILAYGYVNNLLKQASPDPAHAKGIAVLKALSLLFSWLLIPIRVTKFTPAFAERKFSGFPEFWKIGSGGLSEILELLDLLFGFQTISKRWIEAWKSSSCSAAVPIRQPVK